MIKFKSHIQRIGTWNNEPLSTIPAEILFYPSNMPDGSPKYICFLDINYFVMMGHSDANKQSVVMNIVRVCRWINDNIKWGRFAFPMFIFQIIHSPKALFTDVHLRSKFYCIWKLKSDFQNKLKLCPGIHAVNRRVHKVNPVYTPAPPPWHYNDVIMGMIASQITSLMIFFSAVYLDRHQRKHQSSMSLAFVRGIHRRPVNSPHKWPVTRKMFPFDDVIMSHKQLCWVRVQKHTELIQIYIDRRDR